MTREVQERGFRKSDYERPNSVWVCGWERDGRPCPLGPDRKGNCVVTHECTPYRKGDSWKCARGAAFGGACDDGPLSDGTCCKAIDKCQPERSIRASRGRASQWSVGVLVAALAILITGGGGRDFISPGPLSYQHGVLESDCGRCHSAGAGGAASWFVGLLHGAALHSESQNCLACHSLGDHSLQAHGLPQARLDSKTRDLDAMESGGGGPMVVSVAGLVSGVPQGPDGEVACASCHREHHGQSADLTELSNGQCQVCHTRRFGSLGEGHPEFTAYPYSRRTRIKFNHITHRSKYFPDRFEGVEEPFNCIGCHEPEPSGRTMRVKSFGTACAGCHDADVTGEGLSNKKKGVAVLNLPTLDTKSIAAGSTLPLGSWPKSKRGKPSPWVDLLVLGNEKVAPEDVPSVRTAAGEKVNLAKLKKASPEELDTAVRYAWAVKKALHDLIQEGHGGLGESLTAVTGVTPDAEELGPLAGELERETLDAALAEWLPQLEDEVKLFDTITEHGGSYRDLTDDQKVALRDGLHALAEAASSGPRRLSDTKKERWVESGGWYRTKGDTAIRYRSVGHADPFLRAWLDFSARQSGDGAASPAVAAASAGIFRALTATNVAGRCGKCHSVDEVAVGEGEDAAKVRVVNWQPYRADPAQHLPTEFAHQPHFSIEDVKTCSTCHDLHSREPKVASEEFETLYTGLDPAETLGNFMPMTTETCARCHTAQQAGDRCSSCHNYHVGEFVPLYLTGVEEARTGALAPTSEPPEQEPEQDSESE